MKTLKAWQESDINSFDQFVPKYSEVDEEIYWYFLEILPLLLCPSGFMVSEPYSYCSEHNTETYACFVQLGDKYYYLGNISPKAVRSEISNLRVRLSGEVKA